MMRPAPNRDVVAWLDEQLAETPCVSAVSVAELLLGIALLPDGELKAFLERAFRERESRLFGRRVLSFGEREARAYANVVGRARIAGHDISVADGQLAATAVAAGLSVVTRDRTPFEAVGFRVYRSVGRALAPPTDHPTPSRGRLRRVIVCRSLPRMRRGRICRSRLRCRDRPAKHKRANTWRRSPTPRTGKRDFRSG